MPPTDPSKFVARGRVDEDGNVTGLDVDAGQEVIVFSVPEALDSERVEEVAETPRDLALELMAVFYEHKELGEEQAERFRERYGELPTDDLIQRVEDINDDLRDRFEEVTQDLGSQYEKVEAELEERLREALALATGSDAGSGDVETPARSIDLEETEGEPASEPAAREAGAAASQPDDADRE
jgi:hypothetical protein